MSFYLTGHTGGMNRGCEAIVRSTVKVLNQKNGDIFLATFSPDQDRNMSRELGITLIPYSSYPTTIHRYLSVLTRKIIPNSVAGIKYIEKPLIERLSREDICLTIGGDTYCYGRPIMNIAFNKFTTKKGIKNILWCCSIEKENINSEVFNDLNRYAYIFAREIITYNNLIEAGINPNKVVKCCDPAFFLDKQEVVLPQGFDIGNTVGINVSEMVIKDSNPSVYKNVIELINFIIEETDMSVCLIPHVYSISKNKNDYPILKKIHNEINNERVTIIDKEYNCEQLKYIISNCRFFVGARTHSTIAAYSSGVPTLVLGYSVKSKGIAEDLFGSYDGYVLPYNELNEIDTLKNAFCQILNNESYIINRLKEFLPLYKATLTENVKNCIISGINYNKSSICDVNQCTGCSACETVCHKHCITMVEDSKGFLCPEIDLESCVNCGKCRDICPVKNKYVEDNLHPKTYMAINKDKSIKMKSSSGGFFSALAEEVIQNGGVVYGAAFDDEFEVKHIRIDTLDELGKLRGSKYVQSNTEGIYESIKKDLDSDKLVLFTGTPCQIAGVYAVFGKHSNLITQDIVCHGVPSPMVWRKYIDYREAIAKSKVKNISLRDKSTGWKRYSISFDFENGNSYSKPLTEDYYMRGYLSHMFVRESCTECSFKNIHRQSDITLADYWGIEKQYPEKNDDTGISLVMLHSKKGQELFDKIKGRLIVEEVDYVEATNENKSIISSVKKNPLSEDFYKNLDSMRFDKLIDRYYGDTFTAKARRFSGKLK